MEGIIREQVQRIVERFYKLIETKTYFRRFEADHSAVYIFPDQPDWIAVNKAGDDVLKALDTSAGHDEHLCSDIVQEINRQKFLNTLPKKSSEVYKGRAEYIELSHIDECWLHITDRCNLRCTHCLFSCSPKKKEALQLSDITKIVDEAYRLGARVFYLTGGEPFVHNDIENIVGSILTGYKDTSLVVMTNGTLIPNYLEFLKTLPTDRLFFR